MAADARGFPGGNNINVAFIWSSNFHFAQHHHPPLPTSRHTVVAFLAPVLVDFVQLKFQGKDNVSSFETHQKALRVAIASLLLYCFAYDAEHRLPGYARMVRRSMVWFASVSLASLVSILVPDKARLALYLLCALFLATESAVLQMLWNWLRRRMISSLLQERLRRPLRRRGRALNRGGLLPL